MNKDRFTGTFIFGITAVVLIALGRVPSLRFPGFDVWDAAGGFCLGFASASLLFGWDFVRRNLGIEYLVARLHNR